MELDEVFARVLGRHVRLIAACVIAGLLAVWLIHVDDRKQYEAAVRMVLDSPDPINQTQASVLADTARGIASGPTLLRTALNEVGASRDPVRFGEKNVDVRPLGSSGVLRLVVTDTDPRVAAAVHALNIRYVITSTPVVLGFVMPDGLVSLDSSRSWTKIYDNGASRIYEWRGDRPEPIRRQESNDDPP